MIAVAAFRKKTKAKSKSDRLDQIWRRIIRERDGRCQMWADPAGCGGSLEAAHLFPRRHRSVRWDPRNGVLLCAFHHEAFDANDYLKFRWAEERLGPDAMADLSERRNVRWDRDYDRVLRDLTVLLNGGS